MEKKEIPLYRKVYTKKNLWRAWQVIRSNGRLSKSSETQKFIRIFDEDTITQINKIAGNLIHKNFIFDKANGIAIARPNKKSRPIVMATVRNRVVQRSILDAIQSDSRYEQLYNHEFSYGGLKEKSVEKAVLKVQELMKSGKAKYFISSDITGFFTDIRRDKVLSVLSEHIQDKDFLLLFENAMKTELSNMASLKEDAELFPIYDTGVAQGCCLSPLVGNIYLNEFDHQLNTDDVFCLRYIDDFIILGPSEKIVNAKFRQALKILNSLGLKAYDPEVDKDKANKGETKDGFDYLGCYISSGSIRPSAKSWKRLDSAIDEVFKEALHLSNNFAEAYEKHLTFAQVIYTNKMKIEGWIKQYSFCDDKRTISHWNETLRKKFLDFENIYFKLLRNKEPAERALLLGFEDLEFSLSFLEKRKKKPEGK